MSEIIDVQATEVLSKEEMQRAKEELNHPNFKKWFKGLLQLTEIQVTFFKLNGEERVMRCTLDEQHIPQEKLPKGTGKSTSDATISVFDLDKQDWRSFRFDSIKEFDCSLPEDSEYPPTPEPVIFDENQEIIDGDALSVTLVDEVKKIEGEKNV
jgi:hypothetical protein